MGTGEHTPRRAIYSSVHGRLKTERWTFPKKPKRSKTTQGKPKANGASRCWSISDECNSPRPNATPIGAELPGVRRVTAGNLHSIFMLSYVGVVCGGVPGWGHASQARRRRARGRICLVVYMRSHMLTLTLSRPPQGLGFDTRTVTNGR
jgi:hypothetical protein